jgi:hypothetical protein
MTDRRGIRYGLTAACAVVAVSIALALTARRAGAGGAPDADGLVYSGKLSDAAGAAISGTRSVGLQVWDRASGGDVRCAVTPSDQELVDGQLSLPLPAACASAVHEAPDLWLELSVDGASLGRSKLGSVPYALESSHSATADRASDAFGPLSDRLDALERTRVLTSGADAPARLCRGTTPIGGTDWVQVSSGKLRVTVDISACGFATRPVVMSVLGGAARHNFVEGGSNPGPPIGKDEAKAFDIVIDDPTGQADIVSANADQWHIAWIAVGD